MEHSLIDANIHVKVINHTYQCRSPWLNKVQHDSRALSNLDNRYSTTKMATLGESPNPNGCIESAHTAKQKHEKSLTSFPAADDDYRYLRKRAAILCAAFNAQPLDVSYEDRAQAWNEYGHCTILPQTVI